MNDEAGFFQVTDLREFMYCPRVVFYTYCLPLLLQPKTYKMDEGRLAHNEEAVREARRSLRAYGLEEGERFTNVELSSPALRLTGRVDLVIRCGPPGAEEVIPVEYKNSTHCMGEHRKAQLTAYALMLEEAWNVSVRRGFLYAIPLRVAEEVVFTAGLRRKVLNTVTSMREMVDREAMPAPASLRALCLNCKFRRFCNDV